MRTDKIVRGTWPMLAAIIGLLALAGCGATGRATPSAAHATAPTTTATGQPRPTVTAGQALTWRQVMLPSGVDLTSGAGYAVSPVDGNIAWLCAPVSASDFAFWATSDTGSSWRQVSALAPATAQPSHSCTLVADQADTRTLVAVFSWGAGADGSLRSMSYVSTDGGAHWRPLPGDIQTMEVATAGTTTYAILDDTAASPADQQSSLVVSGDGLRSWHAFRPGSLGNDSFFRFWLDPASGTLLAATYHNTLWRTTEAGASWSQVSTPDSQSGITAWLPRQDRWEFCDSFAPPPAIDLRCSTDLGATWRAVPTFTYTLQCATCNKGGTALSDTEPCFPDAIASDGALLAACPTSGSASFGNPDALPTTVYRLPLGASAWVSLGAAPGHWLSVSATGPIWSLNAQLGQLAVATLPA